KRTSQGIRYLSHFGEKDIDLSRAYSRHSRHHDEAERPASERLKTPNWHGYLSQNLHCRVTRGVARSCFRRLAAARCYAGACVSTGRYQVRESWRKCPCLFPYCDVDSAFSRAHSDP